MSLRSRPCSTTATQQSLLTTSSRSIPSSQPSSIPFRPSSSSSPPPQHPTPNNQVPDPEQQHRVMIEAVENHMPQVVVIDEIGTEAECSAARTIAQVHTVRGVGL